MIKINVGIIPPPKNIVIRKIRLKNFLPTNSFLDRGKAASNVTKTEITVNANEYRKKVLKNGIDTECKEMLQNLAEEYKFQILAMEVMPDHIHLLVDCKPQFYISDMIKIMKGNLARQMFLAHPELKKELWGGHLWNPSYCAITVSDRSRDQVLAYIEGQKEKEKKKA